MRLNIDRINETQQNTKKHKQLLNIIPEIIRGVRGVICCVLHENGYSIILVPGFLSFPVLGCFGVSLAGPGLGLGLGLALGQCRRL